MRTKTGRTYVVLAVVAVALAIGGGRAVGASDAPAAGVKGPEHVPGTGSSPEVVRYMTPDGTTVELDAAEFRDRADQLKEQLRNEDPSAVYTFGVDQDGNVAAMDRCVPEQREVKGPSGEQITVTAHLCSPLAK